MNSLTMPIITATVIVTKSCANSPSFSKIISIFKDIMNKFGLSLFPKVYLMLNTI